MNFSTYIKTGVARVVVGGENQECYKDLNKQSKPDALWPIFTWTKEENSAEASCNESSLSSSESLESQQQQSLSLSIQPQALTLVEQPEQYWTSYRFSSESQQWSSQHECLVKHSHNTHKTVGAQTPTPLFFEKQYVFTRNNYRIRSDVLRVRSTFQEHLGVGIRPC